MRGAKPTLARSGSSTRVSDQAAHALRRCPICASASNSHYAQAQDIEYCTNLGSFDFFRCESCEVLFISPMLHDRLGEIYPPNYYAFSKSHRGFVQRVKERLDLRTFTTVCRAIAGNNLAVLDVGGGTGWLLDQVRRADARFNRSVVAYIDQGAEA